MESRSQEGIWNWKHSKKVVWTYLAYAMAAAFLIFVIDRAPLDPNSYLVIGFRGLPILFFLYKRARSESSKYRSTTWWGVFLFVLMSPLSIFATYPETAAPVNPQVVLVGSVLAFVFFTLMTVSVFRLVSKSRVLLDSAWLTLASMIAFWFVVLDPYIYSAPVGLAHRVSLIVPVLLLIFSAALIFNLYVHSGARSLRVPASIWLSMALYTIVASADAARLVGILDLEIVSRQQYLPIEFIWFVADFGILLATQLV